MNSHDRDRAATPRATSIVGGRQISDVPPAVHVAPSRIPDHKPTFGEGNTRPAGMKTSAAYQSKGGLSMGMSPTSTQHETSTTHLHVNASEHSKNPQLSALYPSHNAKALDETGEPDQRQWQAMVAQLKTCSVCNAYVRGVLAGMRHKELTDARAYGEERVHRAERARLATEERVRAANPLQEIAAAADRAGRAVLRSREQQQQQQQQQGQRPPQAEAESLRREERIQSAAAAAVERLRQLPGEDVLTFTARVAQARGEAEIAARRRLGMLGRRG